MTSLEEGIFLVKLARTAVTKYMTDSTVMSPPNPPSKSLLAKSGVFVTIEKLKGGARTLRGCIGYPLPYMPLVEATVDSAVSAAFNDPRFPPLKPKELEEVVFEVSVLTPPAIVKTNDPKLYPKLIKVGRDGLIIEKDFYKGLLLPQVPTEYGWDEETFLSECCMKAGLPPDSWLSKDVKVYSFSATVFTEVTPGGDVVFKSLE
ncbi:MAG: TIGR00296 family protein [Candidatus Methanomethylicaceae archaeon]|jgi:uncharacterized protein (TIGR00296 family)